MKREIINYIIVGISLQRYHKQENIDLEIYSICYIIIKSYNLRTHIFHYVAKEKR